MEAFRSHDPEDLRHHRHRPALCRLGSGQKLIRELGICTPEEWGRSMAQVRRAKRRNQFWAALGYPNLVRARAAKREAERRRKLLGLRPRDHSLDHVLEYAAPLLSPREQFALGEGPSAAAVPPSQALVPGRTRLSFSPAAQMVRPSRRL